MTARQPNNKQKRKKDPHTVVEVEIGEIKPSPENDKLYRPVLPTDPSIRELAKSIGRNGLCEPLVLSLDNYILSGHRRFAACKLAGLKHVTARYEYLRRDDDPKEFLVLLCEYNRRSCPNSTGAQPRSQAFA